MCLLRKYSVAMAGALYLMVFSAAVTAQTPDAYENDDSADQANFIIPHSPLPQIHNFHDEGDADWVMFYAIANPNYAIAVEVKNLGTNCDAAIEIYDSDGVTLIEDCGMGKACERDDGLCGENETLEWTSCTRSGIYFVKIYPPLNTYSCQGFGENSDYELFVNYKFAPDGLVDVTGNILDSNGNPVVNAKVWLTKDGVNETGNGTSMPPDGKFVINMHKVGEYTLFVKKYEYQTVSKPVNLIEPPDGQDQQVDVNPIPRLQLETISCKRGDVNGDGSILLDDIKKTFSFLILPASDLEFCAANVIDNGKNNEVKIFIEDVKGVFDIFRGQSVSKK